MTRSFVILHGWQANTEDHWQTWLADRLRERGAPVCYPVLPDPDHPRLEPWLEALETLLPPDEQPVVVCHSLACLLWLHHLARGGRTAPALLVAPPSDGLDEPELQSFFPAPQVRLAEGSRVSTSDPAACSGVRLPRRSKIAAMEFAPSRPVPANRRFGCTASVCKVRGFSG